MYAATYSIYPLNIGYFSHVNKEVYNYYNLSSLLYKSVMGGTETVHEHRESHECRQ